MNVSAHSSLPGSDTLQGVYTHLQPVGGLQPYAASAEELVELQCPLLPGWKRWTKQE